MIDVGNSINSGGSKMLGVRIHSLWRWKSSVLLSLKACCTDVDSLEGRAGHVMFREGVACPTSGWKEMGNVAEVGGTKSESRKVLIFPREGAVAGEGEKDSLDSLFPFWDGAWRNGAYAT